MPFDVERLQGDSEGQHTAWRQLVRQCALDAGRSPNNLAVYIGPNVLAKEIAALGSAHLLELLQLCVLGGSPSDEARSRVHAIVEHARSQLDDKDAGPRAAFSSVGQIFGLSKQGHKRGKKRKPTAQSNSGASTTTVYRRAGNSFGFELAGAVASALGLATATNSYIKSDENDEHPSSRAIDGAATIEYETTQDNETPATIAELVGAPVADVIQVNRGWYPDIRRNSRFKRMTYLRIPPSAARLPPTGASRAVMTVCGISDGPELARAKLGSVETAGGRWVLEALRTVRYGAYVSGRLGLHASFSVVHECNSVCACAGRDCGNRVVQRGIPAEVRKIHTASTVLRPATPPPTRRPSSSCRQRSSRGLC
eukprot:COSAG01_NODE_13106_length_1634_cov_7.207818_1_plen_368_part_00